MAAPEIVAQWNAYAAIGTDVEPEAPAPECLDFLAKLAGTGHALDLGPGTGRVALPLARRGIPVTALDISPTVIENISAAAQELPIDLVVGDMADFTLRTTFDVVYSTWSTFFALLTQEEQASCFQCVSAALSPTGSFVVDVFSPINDPGVRSQSTVSVRAAEDDHVDLSYMRHRSVAQRIRFQEVRITASGNRLTPVDIRYAWPSEIDLMARLAGLRLTARYADWSGQPFLSSSYRNIAVYSRS
jgi:SAM-dependent methyltransferase